VIVWGGGFSDLGEFVGFCHQIPRLKGKSYETKTKTPTTERVSLTFSNPKIQFSSLSPISENKDAQFYSLDWGQHNS
jgi:hypothetical protein